MQANRSLGLPAIPSARTGVVEGATGGSAATCSADDVLHCGVGGGGGGSAAWVGVPPGEAGNRRWGGGVVNATFRRSVVNHPSVEAVRRNSVYG